ncbi:NAD(P)/FAD-dependent oxidoreductase [Roseomonas populi]|uniref:NAD(P)/FAD-dependent oxidoreductase n=1 Tax=Roseomonas populi TaxID=3121582 RepID=A0ABT1WYB1_9PROT|nr:NAD(P)/FAD-dependent oxidoreductase [Roseomonas pecuniae]MCR0980833.1 NAD(P)/FAD-dependent oxidoreductase [Roseomonas pecuniae]
MAGPHRLVVVGAGAGGLDLATRLARRRVPGLAVTLVDRASSHVWKPRLHQVAAGTLDTAQDEITYLDHAARLGMAFRPGLLRGIDRAARRITLGTVQDEAGRDEVTAEVPYDTLVLAIGSTADDFGTPGVREHAVFIDSREQAEAFRVELRRAVVRALDDPAVREVSIVIVGGGATGTELAAELHQALDLASGYGVPDLRDRLRVTLVEMAPRILSALPEKVSTAATAVLRNLGVTVLTEAAVASVDEAGVTLKDGRRVEASIQVWAAGVRAPAITRALDGLELDRAGRIRVGEDMVSLTDPAILALGDCAALIPAGGEKPLPATAQVAHQQARHLARHLPARLSGTPLPPFRYVPRGSLVSLGDYDAFGSLGRLGILKGAFIEGWLAQLSYTMLYRQFQLVVHGWRAPLVWLAGALRSLARPSVRLD